jgi:hypothetical protein
LLEIGLFFKKLPNIFFYKYCYGFFLTHKAITIAMASSTPFHFCSFLLLLLFLPFLPTVFTYSKDDCNIQQPLHAQAQKESHPWITSPSGEFAFGFYLLQNNEKENQFLLAVWFNKIKDQTIVWSANGNKTAPQDSVLKQNNNNEFVLNDPQGNELWKAPSNGSKSICAAILDSGNLVILDEHIARIDYDGIFRIYKHFRKEDTTESGGSCPSSWTAVQSIPDNICSGGFCGPNSICSTRSDGMAFCLCPAEFSPLYQSGYLAGCKPNFALPSCQDGWEANKELVDFVRLKNVDWPFSDYSFLQGDGVDEASCRQQCLDDCLCVVALYEDKANHCWKLRYPLSNGIQGPNITTISLIKVPRDNGSAKKDRSTVVVVLAVLLGSSAFLNILLFLATSAAVYYLYRKKHNFPWIDITSATNVRRYTYKELEEGTRGFKQILGKGAFGTVYKGVLASDLKRFVAVKKLEKVVEEGEKEFKTEVSVIGQTHHKNLVCLLGYCDEREHRLLVYEYMSNGSLATFLFGISRPHWNQRVQIAFGIARGLMYLHEECSTQCCAKGPPEALPHQY